MILNKKGFSIVEVVIALAILFIVSTAVLSTFLVVDSLTSRYNKLFLGYSVESIVECYYNADTQADFLSDLDFCFGDDSIQTTESGYRLYYSKGNASTEDAYKYYVDFSWSADVLTISAKDNKGKDVIAERGYGK